MIGGVGEQRAYELAGTEAPHRVASPYSQSAKHAEAPFHAVPVVVDQTSGVASVDATARNQPASAAVKKFLAVAVVNNCAASR